MRQLFPPTFADAPFFSDRRTGRMYEPEDGRRVVSLSPHETSWEKAGGPNGLLLIKIARFGRIIMEGRSPIFIQRMWGCIISE